MTSTSDTVAAIARQYDHEVEGLLDSVASRISPKGAFDGATSLMIGDTCAVWTRPGRAGGKRFGISVRLDTAVAKGVGQQAGFFFMLAAMDGSDQDNLVSGMSWGWDTADQIGNAFATASDPVALSAQFRALAEVMHEAAESMCRKIESWAAA